MNVNQLLAFQNRINWLLTTLLCTIAIGLPTIARAEVAKVEVFVTEGDYRQGLFTICLHKKDGIDIAEAFQKGGEEEANKVLNAKESCASIPITFVVGEVQFVANVKNGDFIKVVQVFNPSNVNESMYWITTVTIKKAKPGTKKHKPDNTPRRGQNV